jgi:tetratricopeptide (TPR) repeat protein
MLSQTIAGSSPTLGAKNQRWVDGASVLSHRVLQDLLTWSGQQVDQYYASLNLRESSQIIWAGPDPVPLWFDLARDFTEWWVHQQQIRDAVRVPGSHDRFLSVVLQTFVWAFPYQYRAEAVLGTTVQLDFGDTGGAWILTRELEVAEARGIIEVEGSRLRFTHPLFAAAVYATAPPAERRRMHRRIAAVSEDIEERARHLALGADGVDAGLAAVLDTAAGHARARGAPETAAELAEWSRTLTPPDLAVQVRRRSVQAAEYHFHAGELRRAREMLQAVLAKASGGVERANALRLLGEIHYHKDSIGEAIRVLGQALEYVGDNRELRMAIELSLCYGTHCAGDFAGTAEHADRALTLAELGAERASVAEALAAGAMAGFLEGRGIDEAKIERALRLEDPYHQVPAEVRPSTGPARPGVADLRRRRCPPMGPAGPA